MSSSKLAVGLGLGTTGNAEDDSSSAVSAALEEVGDAKVVLVFENFGDYDRKKAHRGMRKATGSVPLVGCCVAGTLCSKGARNQNSALAVALGGDVDVQIAKVEECHGRYKDAGAELGTALDRPDKGFLILFGHCHGPGHEEAVAGIVRRNACEMGRGHSRRGPGGCPAEGSRPQLYHRLSGDAGR